MLLEVIAESLEDARVIDQSQADRIELVKSMDEGGLTPPLELVNEVVKHVNIPVRVMVRPHSRSFIYTSEDKERMIQYVHRLKTLNVDGIVFGALKDDSSIDFEFLDKILEAKGKLKITFHRAIDSLKDHFERELIELIKRNIDTVLTSMNKPNAMEGIYSYNQFLPEFIHHRVELLAGKGLNQSNLQNFIEQTQLTHIHIGNAAKHQSQVNVTKINELKTIMIQAIE